MLPSEKEAVDEVIEGKSDLAYHGRDGDRSDDTLADFKTLKLTRLTAEVTDAEIDQTLQTIAEQNRPLVAKTRARKMAIA